MNTKYSHVKKDKNCFFFHSQFDWIMSRGLSNASGNGSGFRGLRDYGSTGTGNVPMAGTSGMATGSDVTFAGFSPTEFMSLSENIAQNIGSVKSSWHHLEKIIKIIGGPKDTAAIRDKVYVESRSS